MGIHWSNENEEDEEVIDEEENVVLNYAQNAFEYIRGLEGDSEEYFGYQVYPEPDEQLAVEPEAARLRASVRVLAHTIALVWKEGEPHLCRPQFAFDARLPCTIDVAILTHKREPKNTLLMSKAYSEGFSQQFVCDESDGWFNATEVSEGHSLFVIVVRGARTPGYEVNAQTTCCSITKEEKAESIAIIQKITHNETSYVTKDIFGLEKESLQEDCAICLCENKDSVILPCRHLCVCRACAKVLQATSPKCPICRTIIKAVLMGDAALFAPPTGGQPELNAVTEKLDGKDNWKKPGSERVNELAVNEQGDGEFFFPLVYDTVRSVLINSSDLTDDDTR